MVHDGISQLLDILNMPFGWILVLVVCFRLGVSENIHLKKYPGPRLITPPWYYTLQGVHSPMLAL